MSNGNDFTRKELLDESMRRGLVTKKDLINEAKRRGIYPSFRKRHPKLIEQVEREVGFVEERLKQGKQMGQMLSPTNVARQLTHKPDFFPRIRDILPDKAKQLIPPPPLEATTQLGNVALGYAYERPGNIVRSAIEEAQVGDPKNIFNAALQGMTREKIVNGQDIARNMGITNPVLNLLTGIYYDITTEPVIMAGLTTAAIRSRLIYRMRETTAKELLRMKPVQYANIKQARTAVDKIFKQPYMKTLLGKESIKTLKQQSDAIVKGTRLKTAPKVSPKPIVPKKAIGRGISPQDVARKEVEILKKTGMNNQQITNYVQDTFKNGAKLREYTIAAMKGAMSVNDAKNKVVEDALVKKQEKKVPPVSRYKNDLSRMKSEILEGEAPQRIRTDKGEWLGIPSTYPEFMKGMAKKDVLNIIDKAQTGKKLTERQDTVLRGMLSTVRDADAYKLKEIRVKDKIKSDGDFGVTDIENIIPDNVINDIKVSESAFHDVLASKKGVIDVPALSWISKVGKFFHQWIFAFSELRRNDPESFNKFMGTFARQNAALDSAISDVTKSMAGRTISMKDNVGMSLVSEDKRLKPPPHLKDIYDNFKGILEIVEAESIEAGLFKKPFSERMIEERLKLIDKIHGRDKITKADHKKVVELHDEIDKLNNMSWLSHKPVIARVFESKMAGMDDGQRKIFIDKASRLSSRYRKRKGVKFLKEYLEEGLIKPEDIQFTKLVTEALQDHYIKLAYNDLYNFGKARGLIKKSNKSLRKRGWYTAREIGIVAPELKHQLIHPMFASGLKELKDIKRGSRGSLLRQFLGAVKVSQFIKPQIILVYDLVQSAMKGMYSLNPIKEIRYIAQAYNDVLTQNERYHELNEKNLYQFPYETPKAARDEQINMMVRRITTEIPDWVKKLEKITNMSWAKGDISALDILMAPIRTLSNITWFGDKILRTASVYAMEADGTPRDEAIQASAKGHAAYSEIAQKFKKDVGFFLFVYSFRVLMPMEMAKIITEPVRGVLDAKTKGEKIPDYKKKRWAKSIIATLLMPILIDQYMKARGFEKDKAFWKWKKEVVLPNGRRAEIVVGLNFILNMPIKWWHRLTARNPITPHNQILTNVTNFLQWEVNPLWRVLFWDIAKNKRSFGNKDFAYNPNDPPLEQLRQISTYSFGSLFRFWGSMSEKITDGKLPMKEQEMAQEILDEGLSGFDKVLFSIFGYYYVRQNLRERQSIMIGVLENEYNKRLYSGLRKYKPKSDKSKKYRKSLEKWYLKARKWIQTEMR